MLKKVQSNVYRLKHCDLGQTDTQKRAFEKIDGENRAFNQEWTLTCSSFPQAVQNQHVFYLRLRRLLKSGTCETLLLAAQSMFWANITIKIQTEGTGNGIYYTALEHNAC